MHMATAYTHQLSRNLLLPSLPSCLLASLPSYLLTYSLTHLLTYSLTHSLHEAERRVDGYKMLYLQQRPGANSTGAESIGTWYQVFNLLLTAYCLLLAACCLLLTACHILLTDHH